MMLEIEEDCGVFQLISRKEAPWNAVHGLLRCINRKSSKPTHCAGWVFLNLTLTAQQTHGTQSMGFYG